MPAPPAARRRAVLPRQSNPAGGTGISALPTPSDTDNAGPTSATSTSETPTSSTPTSTSTVSSETTTSTRIPTSTPSSSPTSTSTPTSTPTPTSTSQTSTRSSTETSSTETSSTTPSSASTSSSTSTGPSSSPTSTPVSSSTATSSTPSSANLTSATPFTTLSATVSSSGASYTTFTSSIVTEINGTPTTAPIAIVTALNPDSSGDGLDSHERTAVIAGAAVGGTALLVILFAGFFFYRRRVDKKRYTFLKREPPSRAAFLADELAAPPHGGYRDDPFAPGGAAAGGAYELPQRLLRARNSESGSMFTEEVWPPPRHALQDPITGTPSLHDVVEGVMGPSGSSSVPSQTTLGVGQRLSALELETRLRGGLGDASLWSQASAPRPMSETSRTNLIPEHDSLPCGHGRDASDVPLLSDTASAIEYDMRLGPLVTTNPDTHSIDLPSPPPSGLPGHPNWLERTPRRVDGSGG